MSTQRADGWLSCRIGLGSVTGADHLRSGRGSQDGWAVRREGGLIVATVTDGCGSGRASEVGARLGAELWSAEVARLLRAGANPSEPLWRAAERRLLAQVSELAAAIDAPLEAAVRDYWLFTLLSVAFTPAGGSVFLRGDGIVALDADATHVEAPNNAPDYLGYGVIGAAGRVRPRIWTVPPDCRRVVLATDGASQLMTEDARLSATFSDLIDDAKVGVHPDFVRRRLYRLARGRDAIDWQARRVERQPPLLRDDTTVCVLTRSSPCT